LEPSLAPCCVLLLVLPMVRMRDPMPAVPDMAGRCRLTVSKLELKARLVSAISA